MKKLLVDIYHLPQFNFLKNTILSFNPNDVHVFCVNRGKLLQVIKHELPNYSVTCLGDYKHNKGMYSMVFKIIIPRILRLYRMIHRGKYGFILTAHYQANFVAWLRRIPNIAFNDDPRKYVFSLLKLSADEIYLPPFTQKLAGTKVFNALKEWAYLSPKYFTPKSEVLSSYGLEPKNYTFIREVSTKTSNYLHQQEDAILSIASEFPKDWPVVLSLENKEKRALYPAHWIILEEPVECIHSLMYYSNVVISSGDSMAREGAILGVPSLYAGSRDMPANQIMIDKGMLIKVNPDEVVDLLKEIFSGKKSFVEQDKFRDYLVNTWDDITTMIIEKVKNNNKKDK